MKKVKSFWLYCCMALLFGTVLFSTIDAQTAQESDTVQSSVDTTRQDQSEQVNKSRNDVVMEGEPDMLEGEAVIPKTEYEYQLSFGILVFGLILVIIEMYLIVKRDINAEDAIKFIVITIIITSTLFLIIAGYTNTQIAPAMGLLGTIAGYLLGKMNQEKKSDG